MPGILPHPVFRWWCAVALPSLLLSAATPYPPAPAGFEFIDTSFENASPLTYEFAPDGTVLVNLLYDHERNSPNRAAGHFHFLIQARPGTPLTIELRNFDNVWNGRASPIASQQKSVVVSEDGRHWTPVATRFPEPGRPQLVVTMPGPRLYVARLEPYRISDLEKHLEAIRGRPEVETKIIGHTVQGRELEIVRVGREEAPHRVFIRARAHPWEPGGNWVAQGLMDRLLRGDADARRFLDRYCLYVMPMANKDGVARGGTRFNLQGADLNRGWDQPADPASSPENAALEQWLDAMSRAGRRPDLALDLHNDAGGDLHISRPQVPELPHYLENMARLDRLLRRHTWFTARSTAASFRVPGSLGDGWLERFGIHAAILEFNANWIPAREKAPVARDWQDFGAGLAEVFYDYFAPPPKP